MRKLDMTRRQFLGTTAASTLVLTGGLKAHAADGITIGMIYVGPRDDYGWNQAHAVGAKALKSISGVTVVEEENVPETNAITQTKKMEDRMIKVDRRETAVSEGVIRLFRSVQVVEAAKKFPDRSIPPSDLAVGPQSISQQNLRRVFLLPRPGPLCERRGRRIVDQIEQDRLCRSEAHLACPAQHQCFHVGREEGEPCRQCARGDYGRLVASCARGRSDERLDGCRLRRDNVPRRQSQGRDPDGGTTRR